MLSFSRHLIDSFDQMEDAMQRAAENTCLRIGCSVTVGTCLIHDILDQAKEKMPELTTRVIVNNSSDIEQAILNNEVDLGIVEGILKSNDLTVTPVCQDELVIVCGKDHPLAKEQIITPDMLSGQSYISRESGSTDRNQLERLFEEHGLQLTRTFCSTNTEAIKNAVIRGSGIAVLSRRMITGECEAGDIVILHVEGLTAFRNINLVIHKNKYLSKSIRMMQQILCATPS